jgi:hypothetical protein
VARSSGCPASRLPSSIIFTQLRISWQVEPRKPAIDGVWRKSSAYSDLLRLEKSPLTRQRSRPEQRSSNLVISGTYSNIESKSLRTRRASTSGFRNREAYNTALAAFWVQACSQDEAEAVKQAKQLVDRHDVELRHWIEKSRLSGIPSKPVTADRAP